ncbi:hypothetical protein L596_022773 [Steinernema carpocapsae]|uniref:Uncharacterized protein n=1 Tax=Steinernema carpocapsae TaxID=34508 RepID=A0A4U5MMP3_STECR|nr:hypothetical protein L596_022773 [Steinernema carpocapsae]
MVSLIVSFRFWTSLECLMVLNRSISSRKLQYLLRKLRMLDLQILRKRVLIFHAYIGQVDFAIRVGRSGVEAVKETAYSAKTAIAVFF